MLLDTTELVFDLALALMSFGSPHVPRINEHRFSQSKQLARRLKALQNLRKPALYFVTRD
ncbi:hypothetical protein ACFHWW_23120 [Ensifer sp. P24N7]|uniref:hypothetical protein n=1 Tax=Sinorhizobium sp. P24N7 TaxID=3348358 RepID=UPI0035F3B003